MASLKFLKSAVEPQGYPVNAQAEVAVVGRSNAGKSSLINTWGRTQIAHVSKTPGKTQLLNFYDSGGEFRLVDMPGYGFAARKGTQVRSWQKMVETYISTRSFLVGLLLVVDIRRPLSEDEELLFDWMKQRDLPTALVLTKADKWGYGRCQHKLLKLERERQSRWVAQFAVSSLKATGIEELRTFVYNTWVAPSTWDASTEFYEKDQLLNQQLKKQDFSNQQKDDVH